VLDDEIRAPRAAYAQRPAGLDDRLGLPELAPADLQDAPRLPHARLLAAVVTSASLAMDDADTPNVDRMTEPPGPPSGVPVLPFVNTASALTHLRPIKTLPPLAPASTGTLPPPAPAPPPMVTPLFVPAEGPWATGHAGTGMTYGQAVVLAKADAELRSGARAKRTQAPTTPPRKPWSKLQRPLPAKEAKPVEARRVMELLWFDPGSVERIRGVPAFWQVLKELQQAPIDEEGQAGDEAPWRSEDRREVFAVLARATLTTPRATETALREACQQDGELVPPLVLLAGEVELRFDELAALKAALSMASMLPRRGDDTLREAMERAGSFLQSPSPESLPDVAEELTAPIRAAIEAHDRKKTTATKRAPQIERGLALGGHHQKRRVFGAAHIRCLLRLPGETSATAAYGAEEIGAKLPVVRRFQARMVAEVRPPPDEDQEAGATHALRMVALARVIDQR
jgi:hypothetical protein